MTKTEVDRFRAVLTTTVAELARTRDRDGITLERSADQLDEIQAASQRALAVCSLNREFNQLRDARAALRRIQEGNFGICQECEEEIHPKRLAAVPWATFCIRCQERVVLADDRLDDVACKLEHFRKVIDARAAA
jgi:DnaK suppressor protein